MPPDIGNSAIFSQTDANNNSATPPGWNGAAAPSTLKTGGQGLQGAITRDWNWRNYTVTSTGSSNAYVLTYSVAPAAYYTGSRFAFITNFGVTGTATVNVNTLGAKTIKKDVAGVLTALSSGDIASGQYIDLVYNGTDMVWVNWQGASAAAVTANSTTEVLTGTDTTKFTTADSLAALWEQGSDVASAGTMSLGEGGYFNITGTTTITDIDFATDKAGRRAWLKFAGILTLTHNASTLILPSGANITTAAGDTAEFISEGSDVVRCVSYTKASGLPVVNPAGTLTVLTKTANDTRTTTTPTSDSHLTFSMLANTNYLIKGRYVGTIGFASTGIKIGLSGPTIGAGSVLFSIFVKENSNGAGNTFTNSTTSATGNLGNDLSSTGGTAFIVDYEVVWKNGANAGTFVLQTAQNTASGTLTLQTNSTMTYVTF